MSQLVLSSKIYPKVVQYFYLLPPFPFNMQQEEGKALNGTGTNRKPSFRLKLKTFPISKFLHLSNNE